MNIKRTIKLDIYKILLIVCAIVFVGIVLLNQSQTKILDRDRDGLAQIESINSNIQRLSKLELENNNDDTLIAMIDVAVFDILPNGSPKYFTGEPELIAIVEKVVVDWENFKDIVINFRLNEDRDTLFSASENNYNDSLIIIKSISAYIAELSNKISQTQNILVGLVIVLALLLVKILLDTLKELQHNKEISKEMYIDTATGIYNRSKCQEIMKISPTNTKKDRAVIIFDLNDLKKTNDSLGHRAGDELISSFAQQVKEATNIFPYEIFVGRYGGDEFMAFLDSIDERDVQRYIEEVNYLLNKFNETAGKPYKLSCAAGYGITTQENKSLTVRELFDIADEDMYKNKIAMKEKKKQELIAQGIEVVEEVDDRL